MVSCLCGDDDSAASGKYNAGNKLHFVKIEFGIVWRKQRGLYAPFDNFLLILYRRAVYNFSLTAHCNKFVIHCKDDQFIISIQPQIHYRLCFRVGKVIVHCAMCKCM